jgi:DnaJ family protein B protein 4
MDNSSFYDILEVNENSSMEDIKRSYRKLSLKFHPDKNGNSAESQAKFQKIGEAYETLSDPEKRSMYDNMNNNPFGKGFPFSFHNDSFRSDPIDEIFSNLFGFGKNPANEFMDPGPMPFGPNIRIFRQGGHPGINNLQKPTPIIQTILIPISQVLFASTIPIEIERWIIENGTKIFEKETIYVNIPQGADDNEIIIIRDKGNILNDRIRGDIKLFIKIENNTDLKRHGLDLILEKKIKLKEALCGFSFELKYLNGKIYTINNNIGNIIPPNHNKIINNMGLTREGCTGNLIINFAIEFPEKLNNETINILKDLL